MLPVVASWALACDELVVAVALALGFAFGAAFALAVVCVCVVLAPAFATVVHFRPTSIAPSVSVRLVVGIGGLAEIISA